MWILEVCEGTGLSCLVNLLWSLRPILKYDKLILTAGARYDYMSTWFSTLTQALRLTHYHMNCFRRKLPSLGTPGLITGFWGCGDLYLPRVCSNSEQFIQYKSMILHLRTSVTVKRYTYWSAATFTMTGSTALATVDKAWISTVNQHSWRDKLMSHPPPITRWHSPSLIYFAKWYIDLVYWNSVIDTWWHWILLETWCRHPKNEQPSVSIGATSVNIPGHRPLAGPGGWSAYC